MNLHIVQRRRREMLLLRFLEHAAKIAGTNLLAKSFYSSVDVLRIKQILILQNLQHKIKYEKHVRHEELRCTREPAFTLAFELSNINFQNTVQLFIDKRLTLPPSCRLVLTLGPQDAH